ncbi:MAG: stage II sporulation protein P [Bacillota bacterium]
MKKKWWLLLCLLILCLAMMISEAKIPWPKENVALITSRGVRPQGHVPGTVYMIYDQKGNLLTKMSFPVSIGDYLVTSGNKGFIVGEMRGQKAVARYDGSVNLLDGAGIRLQAGRSTGPVCIYHSHSDESYVPNSGTPNEQWGDIYKVGDAMANQLRQRGIKVIHSYNNHNPHDAASYMRSRRTVAQMLKSRPSLLLDIHRDAISDAGYYRKYVHQMEIASVRLVVGKQNANRSVNFDFAKALKAKADVEYPGLVKEIFWARGNYNQDVAPRTILCEFGTHTNTLQDCEKGARLMANVIADTLGATGAGTGSMNRSSWGTAGWIILLLLGGAGAFLLLNAGSWSKIKEMVSKEMTGSMGDEDSEKKPEPAQDQNDDGGGK